MTNDPYEAIAREKRLKRWYRKWKLVLIEAYNPDSKDLRDGEGTQPLPE